MIFLVTQRRYTETTKATKPELVLSQMHHAGLQRELQQKFFISTQRSLLPENNISQPRRRGTQMWGEPALESRGWTIGPLRSFFFQSNVKTINYHY